MFEITPLLLENWEWTILNILQSKFELNYSSEIFMIYSLKDLLMVECGPSGLWNFGRGAFKPVDRNLHSNSAFDRFDGSLKNQGASSFHYLVDVEKAVTSNWKEPTSFRFPGHNSNGAEYSIDRIS